MYALLDKGPLVGMRDADWVGPITDKSPEVALQSLIKSGYPWNLPGTELKAIDERFEIITREYGGIDDAIQQLNTQVKEITSRLDQQADWMKQQQQQTQDNVRQIVREVVSEEHKDWILKGILALFTLAGTAASIGASSAALKFLGENSFWIGPALIAVSIAGFFFLGRRKT